MDKQFMKKYFKGDINMENEMNEIIKYYKQKIITAMDNLNQNKLMNKEIDLVTYIYNKIIIHNVWDYQDKLTLKQIEQQFDKLIELD